MYISQSLPMYYCLYFARVDCYSTTGNHMPQKFNFSQAKLALTKFGILLLLPKLVQYLNKMSLMLFITSWMSSMNSTTKLSMYDLNTLFIISMNDAEYRSFENAEAPYNCSNWSLIQGNIFFYLSSPYSIPYSQFTFSSNACDMKFVTFLFINLMNI